MNMLNDPVYDHTMDQEEIQAYCRHLRNEERSRATILKYRRDVEAFYNQLPEEKIVNKEAVVAYKERLADRYAARSVNSMLSALNQFMDFMGWSECRCKFIKVQRTNFREEEKELTREEYQRLLTAARSSKKEKLYLLLQTICSTGIRVSEHRFITVEAVKAGRIRIRNKGKERVVLLQSKLAKLILRYCKKLGLRSGPVFISRTGKPLDRSNIWAAMKRLCALAQVSPSKVYPHNLRHLFALTYYELDKDIVHLADILGHSSVETTRIYTATNIKAQQRTLSLLGLVRSS